MPINPPANSFQALSRAEWRAWLAAHHTRHEGIWLITYKQGATQPRVEYGTCVEEALCFGWIDSTPNKLDAERTMLWFAPRKPGTGWSRPNKLRIEQMIEASLMAESGLAKVAAAKADGSWTLLDSVEELEVPLDLASAFASYPDAARKFEAFPRSARRGILEWIQNAKRAETRAARVESTARLASVNERANQWSPKK